MDQAKSVGGRRLGMAASHRKMLANTCAWPVEFLHIRPDTAEPELLEVGRPNLTWRGPHPKEAPETKQSLPIF